MSIKCESNKSESKKCDIKKSENKIWVKNVSENSESKILMKMGVNNVKLKKMWQ